MKDLLKYKEIESPGMAGGKVQILIPIEALKRLIAEIILRRAVGKNSSSITFFSKDIYKRIFLMWVYVEAFP